MEETRLSINVRFEPNRATWLALAATGALLVAGVLASISLGAAWGSYTMSSQGSFGGQDFNNAVEVDYKLFEAEGQGGNVEYSASSLDDADGVGMMRAAGPLAIVGVVLAFAGLLVVAASAFVQGFHLRLIGSLTAALAFVFLLLALILLPTGLGQFHETGSSDFGGVNTTISDIEWGAGLILAIIAVVAAAAGGALGLYSMRKDPA